MKLGIGLSLIVASVASVLADRADLKLPTISWGYNFARSAGDLNLPFESLEWLVSNSGLITAIILFLVGAWFVLSKLTSGPPNPVTMRKIQRFKAINAARCRHNLRPALG